MAPLISPDMIIKDKGYKGFVPAITGKPVPASRPVSCKAGTGEVCQGRCPDGLETKDVKNSQRIGRAAALTLTLALTLASAPPLMAGSTTQFEAQAPSNCSPINPKWVSSIWTSPNGLKNIGSSPIWVVCALTRTWSDPDMNVWLDLINQGSEDQEVICGVREYAYNGGTISALALVQVLAGNQPGFFWWTHDGLIYDSGLSVACKLGPKMVLKLISWTPNPDPV